MQLNICEGEGGRAGLRPSGEACHGRATSAGRHGLLPTSKGPAFYFCS